MLYDPQIHKDVDFPDFFNRRPGREWLTQKIQNARLSLAWEEGIEKEDHPEHGLKLYCGEFDKDLPSGRGLQFLQGDTDGKRNDKNKKEATRTVYEGQFKDGKRHGMGVWYGVDATAKNNPWNYKTLSGGSVNNWINGSMHGVATVETEKEIIDKIVYFEGHTDMRKPDPPRVLTAEDAPIDKTGKTLKVWPESATMGMRLVTKLCKEDAADGSGVNNTPSAMMTLLELNQIKEERRNPDLVQGEQLGAMKVLVRQPTDITTPEEDIWISGGTGDNESLNGLYYKMSGTFDSPMYRHAHKKKDGTIVSKFIYRDIAKERWMISESSGYNTEKRLHEITECAMISSTAPEPLKIKEQLKMQGASKAAMEWVVWNSVAGEMRRGLSEVEAGQKKEDVIGAPAFIEPEDVESAKFSFDLSKKYDACKQSFADCRRSSWNWTKSVFITPEQCKADSLQLESIVALELAKIDVKAGSRASDIEQSKILLRNPRVYYGRPVYQTEDGSLYLYWQAENGVPMGGVTSAEMDGPGMVHDLKASKGGFWCISNRVGLRPEDKGCFACVQEKCVTPDVILPNITEGNAPKFTLSGHLIKDAPKNYWLVKDDLLQILDFTKEEEEGLEMKNHGAFSEEEVTRIEDIFRDLPQDVGDKLKTLPLPVQYKVTMAGGLTDFLKKNFQEEHGKAIDEALKRLHQKAEGAHKIVPSRLVPNKDNPKEKGTWTIDLKDEEAKKKFEKEQEDGLERQCSYCGPNCRAGKAKDNSKIQWFKSDTDADYNICSGCVYKGSQAVCGICSSALIELPFARHTCDAKRHPQCQKVGTKYRCGAGHDYDMCSVCYYGTTEVVGTDDDGHQLVKIFEDDESKTHTCDAKLPGCEGTGTKYRCQQTQYEVCGNCAIAKGKEAGVQAPEEKLLGPGMRAVTSVWKNGEAIKTGMSCRVKLGEYQNEDLQIDFEDRFHNVQRWELQAPKRNVKTQRVNNEGEEVEDTDAVSWYGLCQQMKDEYAMGITGRDCTQEEIDKVITKEAVDAKWKELPIAQEDFKIVHKYLMHQGSRIGNWMTSDEQLMDPPDGNSIPQGKRKSTSSRASEHQKLLGHQRAPNEFWKFGIDFRIGHNAWVVSMLDEKKELFRYEFKHRIKEVVHIRVLPKDRETELDRFPTLPGSSILTVRWEEFDENKWKASFIPNKTLELRLFGCSWDKQGEKREENQNDESIQKEPEQKEWVKESWDATQQKNMMVPWVKHAADTDPGERLDQGAAGAAHGTGEIDGLDNENVQQPLLPENNNNNNQNNTTNQ